MKVIFVPMIILLILFIYVFCKLCIAELTRVDVKLRKISCFAFLAGTVYVIRVNPLVVDIELRVRQAWRDFFDALNELNNY